MPAHVSWGAVRQAGDGGSRLTGGSRPTGLGGCLDGRDRVGAGAAADVRKDVACITAAHGDDAGRWACVGAVCGGNTQCAGSSVRHLPVEHFDSLAVVGAVHPSAADVLLSEVRVSKHAASWIEVRSVVK